MPTFESPNIANPAVGAANNRFSSGQGYTYDLVGNVITDPQGRSFNYDAENKQITASGSSGTIGQYYFDGDGKRIKKLVPSTGEITVFVYNASGKLVAEYSTNLSSTPKIQYQTLDNLGTPRIDTDQNGSVVSRSDYMPYGEEIVGLGGRSSTDKYVADDVRQGFTGYINDGETGLDYAQARMYAPILGRFMVPDDFLNDTTKSNPQSWNLYAYVRNSPLSMVDPDGEKAKVTITRDKKTKTATVVIEASFAVYGATGQGVTQEELDDQAKQISETLTATYSGAFDGKDGYSYTVTAKIDAKVFASEAEAKKSKMENLNLVEIGKSELQQSFDNGKTWTRVDANAFRLGRESFDRERTTLFDNRLTKENNIHSHEFAHLLGISPHSKDDADVRGLANRTPARITQNDFSAIFGGQIKSMGKRGTVSVSERRAVQSSEKFIRWKKK